MSKGFDIKKLMDRVEALEYEIKTMRKEREVTFDIEELSNRTAYSVNYLYKKVKDLTLDKHYFKPNNGRLLFDESAVNFLIKGGNHGKSVPKTRQPISLDNFFS